MKNLQEAANNIEQVMTMLINDPPEDLNVNDLIKDWNLIRQAVAQTLAHSMNNDE